MPVAIGLKRRKEIVERREAGETFASIARDLGMYYGTVRTLWQHYQRTGQLSPSYEACAQGGIRKEQAIYERAVALKGSHPRWGAGLIWVELAEAFDEQQLPSERTLQRWFHRAGLVERKGADRQDRVTIECGRTVHEVWALDAKEQIHLDDGSHASWVALSDESSGAMLEARAFPPQEVE